MNTEKSSWHGEAVRNGIFSWGSGTQSSPLSLHISNLHCAVSPHLHLSAGPLLFCPPTHPVINYTAHSGSVCMNHHYSNTVLNRPGGTTNFATSFCCCLRQRSVIRICVMLCCNSRIYHDVQEGITIHVVKSPDCFISVLIFSCNHRM